MNTQCKYIVIVIDIILSIKVNNFNKLTIQMVTISSNIYIGKCKKVRNTIKHIQDSPGKK